MRKQKVCRSLCANYQPHSTFGLLSTQRLFTPTFQNFATVTWLRLLCGEVRK